MNKITNKEEEIKMIIGYKVFNSNWTCSPNGNTKQYSCPGKFEEDVIPVRCGTGMHFCRRAVDCFNYYDFDSNNKVAEIIAYGDTVEEGDKCCTNKLEIIRELTWHEVLELVNTGKDCTGIGNSGNENSGNRNSGNENSGNENSGSWQYRIFQYYNSTNDYVRKTSRFNIRGNSKSKRYESIELEF